MRLDSLATTCLATLEKGEIPGGTSFRERLPAVGLDYSWESLTRVDRLLDQIRLGCQPGRDHFFDDQANQNFLYLLGFYSGAVLAKYCGGEIHWYEYEQMTEVMPGMKDKFPYNFSTSVTCILSKGDKRKDTYSRRLFVPLAPIQERLFESYPARSLHFATRSALF